MKNQSAASEQHQREHNQLAIAPRSRRGSFQGGDNASEGFLSQEEDEDLVMARNSNSPPVDPGNRPSNATMVHGGLGRGNVVDTDALDSQLQQRLQNPAIPEESDDGF